MIDVRADEDRMPTRREARIDVMGTTAHVITIGAAGPGLVESACSHLLELEARWSRFRASSEISRLNANDGEPLVVSAPTVALLKLALDGWRVTKGCFDPTILGDVVRAGYDRTFCAITADTARGATSALQRGCDAIEIDTATGVVRLPRGVGVDPGGIGKGLAADLVVDALRVKGAAGACVNVGGDVRVEGVSPGNGWTIELRHLPFDRTSESVRLVAGAIATSAMTYRSWTRAGARKHHLIDPRTGDPVDNDIVAVSVAAARGWQADVLTKAIFVAGVEAGMELADDLAAGALAVTADGRRHVNRSWSDVAARPPDRETVCSGPRRRT